MVVTTIEEADAPRVAEAIHRLGAPQSVGVRGGVVRARVRNTTSLLPELLRTLDAAGVPVAEAEVSRATLDDVFLTLTGRSLRESAIADENGRGADRAAAASGAGAGTVRILEEHLS